MGGTPVFEPDWFGWDTKLAFKQGLTVLIRLVTDDGGLKTVVASDFGTTVQTLLPPFHSSVNTADDLPCDSHGNRLKQTRH